MREAEFLADWDDDAPPARSGAAGSNPDLVVSDDDSTDDERDDRGVAKETREKSGRGRRKTRSRLRLLRRRGAVSGDILQPHPLAADAGGGGAASNAVRGARTEP